MALADILAAIDAEADQEIARVVAETAEQTAQIRNEARDEADMAERAAASALDDESARRRAQIVNRAHLVVERRLSAAVEDVYQDLLTAVERRLVELRGEPEYADLFSRLLEECRAVLPEGRVVRIDPADEPLCRDVLATDDGFTIDGTLRSAGGLEIATADGRRSVRNTLESRTWRADRALRSLAAARVPPLGGGA
ncbi:MAG: V-type ATP synthase subunit E [Ilumatobacter sp.]|uniref:V-type ATP synthase subunit E n=1 Tax=Ilumatobacter sp. TaxID=1967498 RepID=UPI00260FBF7D|nr:V-type ATP synthase subunit E [Ilumatobacter sp.]MDJ0768324.1 V-type ATP synthase subunit E [Ilumatobacter sp.]